MTLWEEWGRILYLRVGFFPHARTRQLSYDDKDGRGGFRAPFAAIDKIFTLIVTGS